MKLVGGLGRDQHRGRLVPQPSWGWAALEEREFGEGQGWVSPPAVPDGSRAAAAPPASSAAVENLRRKRWGRAQRRGPRSVPRRPPLLPRCHACPARGRRRGTRDGGVTGLRGDRSQALVFPRRLSAGSPPNARPLALCRRPCPCSTSPRLHEARFPPAVTTAPGPEGSPSVQRRAGRRHNNLRDLNLFY